jgi:hypothetical protein
MEDLEDKTIDGLFLEERIKNIGSTDENYEKKDKELDNYNIWIEYDWEIRLLYERLKKYFKIKPKVA